MPKYDYDLTIIGAGSAGLPAAHLSGSLGARTLIVDRERIGGECLHTGCVPSKAFIHAAGAVQSARAAARFGLQTNSGAVDLRRVQQHVHETIAAVGATEEERYLRDADVRFGQVEFESRHALRVDDERILTRSVLICTGSRPAPPPIPGLEAAGFLTSEDVFDLDELPDSLIVIGGGPVGVELGQAFARLGSAVTILEMRPWLLPEADGEACDELYDSLECEGLTLATNAPVRAVRAEGGQKVVAADVNAGGAVQEFAAREILVAAGRRPNVEGLNLAQIGVQFSEHGIRVNERLQTTAPNIYAAGDVIGGQYLTHLAAAEATTATQNALAPFVRRKMDYRAVPWVAFTDPEVAGVGLTEMQAREKHKRVRVVRFPWREVDRAHAYGATHGFIKLVLAGRAERLVGAHLIGRDVGELLPELVGVLQQRKGLDAILYRIHAYPTMAAGLQQAAWEGYRTSPTFGLLKKALRPVFRLLG